MKLRHIVVTGGLAVALLAGVNVRAFADERPDTAAADAAQTSTPAAGSSKKAVRAANRTFSRSVQKALSRTKGAKGRRSSCSATRRPDA